MIRGDQVADVELHDFEITQEHPPRDARQVFHAVDRAQNKPVRLTVFSSDMSQRPEFRRALKTDRAMLSMLMHQSIVKFWAAANQTDNSFFGPKIVNSNRSANNWSMRELSPPKT